MFLIESYNMVGLFLVRGTERSGIRDFTHIEAWNICRKITLLESFGIESASTIGGIGDYAPLPGVVSGTILFGSILEGDVS